jgi:Domain of unknown function (DUF4136)
MRNALFALATCIAMTGCASPLTTDFDYDTAADFGTLKTYDWMPATGNAASDQLLVKRIRTAVDSQLQAKGHAPAPDNPDFLIAMQLSGRTAYGGSTGVGMSVGIPVGRAGRISVGGGKSKPIEKTEGTLVLDFLDAKSKALVWQGTASGAVQPSTSPEQQQQRINEVVAQLLAQFPPKK